MFIEAQKKIICNIRKEIYTRSSVDKHCFGDSDDAIWNVFTTLL